MARARGLVLDAARAAALRPQLESLLARLARLAESLPSDVEPADAALPPPGDGP